LTACSSQSQITGTSRRLDVGKLVAFGGMAMGWYDRHVFPWVLEKGTAVKSLREPRRRVLAAARGRVLEIGFGTGVNLEHYPAQVEVITVVEPALELSKYAQRRIERTGRKVEVHVLGAEDLPFQNESFDTVVSTLTLCSIAPIDVALRQVHRVMKRDGQFLFLEHGRHPNPRVARWQNRLNPLQQRLAGGCNLNRSARELLQAADFQINASSDYQMPGTPGFLGWMTEGVATRAAVAINHL
jgi:ubiquinone/menaquinone biosynthesis C-methylase UbiE